MAVVTVLSFIAPAQLGADVAVARAAVCLSLVDAHHLLQSVYLLELLHNQPDITPVVYA